MIGEGSVSLKSAGWMPCTMAALMACGMVVSYLWSVCKNDVQSLLPFISSAGGIPPQSGVFAIFLFLSAAVGLLTLLVRHATIQQEALRLRQRWMKYLNNFALVLGLFCLAGMLVVAAYPIHSWRLSSVGDTMTEESRKEWTSSVLIPHTLGAAVCLSVGFLCALAQAVLSLRLKPALSPEFFQRKHPHLFAARVAACTVAFAALLAMSIIKKDKLDPWKDTKDTTGRAVAEWIVALMLGLLFVSLYPEMTTVQLEAKATGQPGETVAEQAEMVVPAAIL